MHVLIAPLKPKNRPHGHSMPPRSDFLKKTGKFFFRQTEKIKLILFYKK
jgi:hypothetical protein